MLGFPEDEAEKAKDERVERLKQIAIAQGGTTMDNPASRGLRDLDPNPQSGRDEKKNKPQRGQGK
jgi:hypothetical protein